jgi:hypothetical protein
MGQLSRKLRGLAGGGLAWWCPGCEAVHQVTAASDERPGWTYNGNPEAPTFQPSVLVTSGHFAEEWVGPDCWCTARATRPDSAPSFKCARCHTFITDGMIQFLGDCSHALAGQTVAMPDLPPHLTDGSYGWPD